MKVIPRALTVDFVVRTQNSIDDYLGYLGRTCLEPDGYQLRTTLCRDTQAFYHSLSRIGMLRQWQVRGRSDVRFEEMIRYDITYVRAWSFRLDLQILLETIPVVLSGKGAC